jgi:hypothetical protein
MATWVWEEIVALKEWIKRFWNLAYFIGQLENLEVFKCKGFGWVPEGLYVLMYSPPTGAWSQGLMLARQTTYHLSHFLCMMDFIYLFIYFCWTGVWTLGFSICRVGALPLESHPQPILLWLFGDGGSHELFIVQVGPGTLIWSQLPK